MLSIQLQMDQKGPAQASLPGEHNWDSQECLHAWNLHENLTGLKLQHFYGLTMLLFPLKSDVQTK